MIGDMAYIEAMKNCSKWNGRNIVARFRGDRTSYDPQTNVVQRPNPVMYRSALERCTPSNPHQIVSYPAKRYRRSKQISSESCEYKYFLQSNPALKETVDQVLNPGGLPSSDNSEQSQPALRSNVSNGAKPIYENLDFDPLDYEFDDVENDPSDEDDWGSSRKRKKKNGPGERSTTRPARRGNNAASSSNSASVGINVAKTKAKEEEANNPELRPFVCKQCGARYKSRPGLSYHRLHVHKEEAMLTEMPKMLSNQTDFSKDCDLCQGTKDINRRTNQAEELVSCHDCGRSAHPTCVNFNPNMLISTKKYGWQCIECKSCTFCGTSEDDDKLLFCDDCDRGFHLYCLKPPLQQAPEGKWSCHLCQKEFGNGASLPPGTK